MNFSELSCGHSCVYGGPKGVGTNGPCHCLDGLDPENRRKARKEIHAVRRQEEREVSEKEKQLEAKIEDLGIELEAFGEMLQQETNRAEAIYQGNMRKKKKLRDRIAELEVELLQQRGKEDKERK